MAWLDQFHLQVLVHASNMWPFDGHRKLSFLTTDWLWLFSQQWSPTMLKEKNLRWQREGRKGCVSTMTGSLYLPIVANNWFGLNWWKIQKNIPTACLYLFSSVLVVPIYLVDDDLVSKLLALVEYRKNIWLVVVNGNHNCFLAYKNPFHLDLFSST